jgi:hypothetical protein
MNVRSLLSILHGPSVLREPYVVLASNLQNLTEAATLPHAFPVENDMEEELAYPSSFANDRAKNMLFW